MLKKKELVMQRQEPLCSLQVRIHALGISIGTFCYEIVVASKTPDITQIFETNEQNQLLNPACAYAG